MANPSNDEVCDSKLRLFEEVRRLTCKTSVNFVVEPSIDMIESDILIGVKRFKQAVRNRWMSIEARQNRLKDEENKKRNTNELEERIETSDESDSDESFDTASVNENQEEGLGTNLRNTGRGHDEMESSSREVEGFLWELENELIGRIETLKNRIQEELERKRRR